MSSRRRSPASRGRGLVLVLAALVLLYVASRLPALYGEYRWFVALGYDAVFLTILAYRIGIFAAVSIATFLALYASYYVAVWNVRKVTLYVPPALAPAGLALLSVFVGATYSGSWPTLLRFLHRTPFGVTEPVYGRDVAFYVFELPFYHLVVNYLLLLSLASLGVGLVVYAIHFGQEGTAVTGQPPETFDPMRFLDRLRRYAYGHVSASVGAVLVLAGADYVLRRYDLLFSARGTVFGAGLTDLAVFRPLLAVLAAVAVVGGLLAVANVRLRDDRLLLGPVVAILLLSILGGLVGGAFQAYVVEPDEFNKERPYIEREIAFTRGAFALDRVEETQFPVSNNLTTEQLEANPGTVDNIRLWDYRPLLKTYNELQIFRTYYTFTDVDVDRYRIDGAETQVMVAAREIDFEALPPRSRTWVNRHLVYTHGFGVAMSPVSEVSREGLPSLYVRDIPPTSSVGIEVTQPRIYYGENTGRYALVNTGTRELDYPSGATNVYTSYSGTGGVSMDSALRRVVYALQFGSPEILLSDSITPETRIQFHRDVRTRARTIAPFLEYDADPYVVVADGRLYWLYDAYTTTDRYPYASRIGFKDGRTSYLRNSVKVVVDAYSGETTYYVADPEDPLLRSYAKAFPGLFEPIDAMPASLRAHVRYPEDAFQAQSEVYLDYHVTDPQVFYTREDSWRIPDEITRGQRVPMDPYYVIMTFPGEDDPEFVQIRPFIPRGKENMIGWLAARSDRPNYGRMRAFLFSKQQLVFGPMQIESRIDQDTAISQRITLWSQAGSTVIRGNLLAIPIEDTILYVEPLYLESSEAGSIPELKRVIVAQGDGLTMQPTLEDALAVRFGEGEPAPGTDGLPPATLRRLRTLYAEAQAALREGDLVTYAERVEEIGRVLEAEGNVTAA